MSTIEIAKRYVELVSDHKNEQCLSELFSKDAVSVEAGAPPGQDRTSRGLDAIRAKSIALTEYAIELVDSELPDARLASPRDPAQRGGHVTIDHPRFSELLPRLWAAGVIPDFRRPDGLRLGCSPLSTSFAEVEAGVLAGS